MKLYGWGGEREEKRIKEKIGKPTTRARSHMLKTREHPQDEESQASDMNSSEADCTKPSDLIFPGTETAETQRERERQLERERQRERELLTTTAACQLSKAAALCTRPPAPGGLPRGTKEGRAGREGGTTGAVVFTTRERRRRRGSKP
jgi:hypothetical protein